MASEDDEFGLRASLAKTEKEYAESVARREQWVKEAKHRFDGRWIRNTIHGNLYQVIEIIKCENPWVGGHFKNTPSETKRNMLYNVTVASEIDPNLDDAKRYDTFAEVGISIMDGKWVVATKREVAKAAMELSDKINAKISKELDTVSTLMTIYRLSKGIP
jgi:hypothetical protein